MSTPAPPTTVVGNLSTKPVAKETVIQKIEAFDHAAGIWLTAGHITLLVLLAAAVLFGVYLFESKRADVAEAKAEVATQVAKAAQEAGASAAVQNAAEQEEDKEVEAALTAANQQLIVANQQLQASNVALTTKLLAQRKTDASLPPIGQSMRWQQLVPTATVTLTSTGFNIDAQGGLATIEALEEIPVDRATISNLTEEVNNSNKTIANDASVLAAEKSAHQSDLASNNLKLVAPLDTNKQTLAEYNAYKKKARRNEPRWFGLGVVVGFFGGHALGF